VTEAYLIWGIALLGAAILLLVLELFVPSGGVLGVLAAGSTIAGIVLLFMHDVTWGIIALGVVLVLGPMAITFGLKVFPHTPVGRRLILGGNVTEEDKIRQRQAADAERAKLMGLIGATGKAMTDLRPVGVVVIDGKRYDALAEGPWIDAGSNVRVTVVDGPHVKVRRTG
jgi:membrane-bound ClpP family serine protease